MAFGIGSKIKKGLGSIANKVADKLIPKELAPFLPMLAPLFMGPGAGIMSRYLVPQLLTALSTGKTTGGISGTSQGLAGLASFLSDPSRLKLAEPIEAKDAVAAKDAIPSGMETTMLPGSEQVGFGQLDPATGEFVFPEGGDLLMGPDGTPMTVGDLPKSTYIDGTPMNVVDAGTSNLVAVPDSGQLKVGFGPGQVPPRGYTIPAAEAQAAVQAQPLTKFDTFMNTLKTGVNETRDFMQGTNVANKRPFGDEKLALQSDLDRLGVGTKGYTGTEYAVGDPLLVKDAGFGYNMPRRAVQQGLLSTGPGMAVANKMKADAAAEEAAQQASFDNYYDSRQALFDYFGNAQPNYDMLYRGYNQGGIASLPAGMPNNMQVDGRNGTFIPMGVKEKADDVPAMLSKNEFVMTADAVRAAGGGSVEKGAQRMYDLMNSLEARV